MLGFMYLHRIKGLECVKGVELFGTIIHLHF
jgi:hypothetical protein